MQIETGIHKQFYSNGLQIKQPGRETDNHRHSYNMKDKPAVTAVSVCLAVAVVDSCVVTLFRKGAASCSSEIK